jgi:hypothetical protein
MRHRKLRSSFYKYLTHAEALQKRKSCLIPEKKQLLYEQKIKTDPVLLGCSFGRQPLASAPDI